MLAGNTRVNTQDKKLISLVIPFYNEEANIETTLTEITRHIDTQHYRWEIVAINDGSSDSTLEKLNFSDPENFELVIVDLSRNFGKEAALSAGIEQARGDAIIPLDADLQDPPQVIAQLLEKWEEGYDVVLARRVDRSSDSLLKQTTAGAFYSVINKLSDVAIPHNVGDFRLMDRRVIEVLKSLPEHRRFMKGLFAWAGFRTTSVDYTRPERKHGNTKFSGWKLWNLALEGITSFSIVPLKIWTYIGLLVAFCSFTYGGVIIVRTLLLGIEVPGYASLASIMLFMSGLQMIGMGILGEYVGRTYLESKRRPAFIIRSVHTKEALLNSKSSYCPLTNQDLQDTLAAKNQINQRPPKVNSCD
ncbi:bactoprenol glucosyl transferase [Pseudomonas sp. AP19]|uniref:glycosyltransferase family 2 protein n=1 Tax=Pseudomonas sp. AP19 TaxID=1535623 RepID=UPI00084B7EAE|nr:glycosyltransferase family 2 protein [Pseudomonas sp. AP19]OEC63350.1 bactoprenol glucosyl transferase [Pseudomonas sp. AP19]